MIFTGRNPVISGRKNHRSREHAYQEISVEEAEKAEAVRRSKNTVPPSFTGMLL